MVTPGSPIAALDIGSATVHLLVARLLPAGDLRTVHDESFRPLLGARRAANGTIPPDAAAEAQAALHHLQHVAKEHGATVLLVAATEALRSAPNGTEIVTRFERAIGQPIAILTAAQETRLAMLGAYGPDLPDRALFVDSGGASTELAEIHGHQVRWQRSLSIGAGSITAEYLRGDPPAPAAVRQARRAIRAALATLPAPPAATPDATITGGSATTLAGLGLPECQGEMLSPACLRRVGRLLAARSSRDLAEKLGLPLERARILYGGYLILAGIAAWSGRATWRVSWAGLRQGMIRAWLANASDWWAEKAE